MKNLIIVESPSKAKTIQKYLGDEYTVMASSGHVSDLPQKTLGIDIQNNFEPMYEVNPDKKDTIKRLQQAVKKSNSVYLATDPDREGEAISWHLMKELNLGEDANRIEFNEISKKAVQEAIKSPRHINMDLVNAQQARRVLDRLVGYKISPIISKKIQKGSSAGRVQSPALKMIVEREREINNFTPEEYWNIYVYLTNGTSKKPFRAQFEDFNGEKFKVTSEKIAERAVLDLDKANFVVDSVKKSVSKSKPNPPFTTSTMQQDASSKLGLTSPETMKIAQQLYEGVDIKGGDPLALVTYIRTDSVRVSQEMQAVALNYIKEKYGEEYAPSKPNFYATKKDAQDAHEAIRPINLNVTPESIKDKVSRNQYRLYKLIYERFLASQMKEALYDTLNVHINAFKPTNDKPFGYRVKGKTPKFLGYTIVYQNVDLDKQDEEKEEKVNLPKIVEGDKLNFVESKSEQKFTKPPQRYSDATLVKALEENGIGRPSTYATIISVLSKRAYTEKEGKYIKPTALGEGIYDYLAIYFKDIVNYKFTAAMETKLDEVASGDLVWQDILNKYYPTLEKEINRAYAGSGMKIKVEEEVTDVKCDKCGAFMVVREGKYGKFLACPNFPKCKNIKPLVEKVAVCPKCGGDVIKRHSKTGKLFYGCNNYPKCDFISWDLPAPILCEKCGSIMKMVKRKTKTEYICTNKECGNKVVIEKPEVTEENTQE